MRAMSTAKKPAPKLSAAAKKAAAKAAREALLGPLAPHVQRERFVDGALVSAVLAAKKATVRTIVDDPRWRTVETLELGVSRRHDDALVLAAPLDALKVLYGASEELVQALLTDPTERPLEALYGRATSPRVLPEDVSAPGLPKLHTLAITCFYRDDSVSKYSSTWREPKHFEPFFRSPLAARLACIDWDVHATFAPDVQALLAAVPSAVRARVDTGVVAFARGDDGAWSHLTVDIDDVAMQARLVDGELRTLLRLDASPITRLDVHVHGEEPLDPIDPLLAEVRTRYGARMALHRSVSSRYVAPEADGTMSGVDA